MKNPTGGEKKPAWRTAQEIMVTQDEALSTRAGWDNSGPVGPLETGQPARCNTEVSDKQQKSAAVMDEGIPMDRKKLKKRMEKHQEVEESCSTGNGSLLTWIWNEMEKFLRTQRENIKVSFFNSD